MIKPIYLIGGTAGTGKTTLAREIACYLKLDHRLGTGFIREVVRSETSIHQEPSLFSFSFCSDNPVQILNMQAERLHQAVLSCINRARSEGTSLIIEGTHLIPALYTHAEVDGYIILAAPPPSVHQQRLQGDSHLKREISEHDRANANLIDQHLQIEASKHKIHYLLFENNFSKILKLLAGAT